MWIIRDEAVQAVLLTHFFLTAPFILALLNFITIERARERDGGRLCTSRVRLDETPSSKYFKDYCEQFAIPIN